MGGFIIHQTSFIKEREKVIVKVIRATKRVAEGTEKKKASVIFIYNCF